MPRRSPASQVKLLTKVPVLGTLAPDHLERVAKVVRELLVPADVFVIRENRAGESMYFILHGQLDILKRSAQGQTHVQTVGPGELIGEMALLTGAKRIASAKSLTSCHMLQIDRDDFLELFGTNTEVMAAVWEACEVHGIELMMAGDQTASLLTLEARKQWLGARQIVATTNDQRLSAPFLGFVAVVAGTVAVDGRTFEAPALVKIGGETEVTVRQAGRICWLPALDDEKHAA